MKAQHPSELQIQPLELSISLIGVILGVGILTLPRALAQEIGTTDGWISILISGLIAISFATLYMRLNRQFPDQNLLEYMASTKLGKWVAKLFAICFALYFMCVLAFEARILATVVKIYLLVDTPSEIIVAIMFLVIAYAVTKGLQGIIHLNLLFVPICIVVVIGIILLNLESFDIGELLPIMPLGLKPVLLGVKESIISFLGIEILFFLVMYLKISEMKAGPINKSLAFITLIYVLINMVSFSIFSIETTEIVVFPTVELAKEIDLPGGIFERLESVLITIWMITIFNTMSMVLLLLLAVFQSHFMKKKKSIWTLATITAIAYILSFIPHSVNEAFTFGEWLGYFGAFVLVLSLITGYIFYWIRKRHPDQKKEKKRAQL